MINNNQKKIYYSRRRIYINIMKTTFDLNFELYKAVKQCTDTYKHRSQEKLSIIKAAL